MLSERLKENREALFAYPLGMSIFTGVLILLFGIWLGANVFSSDSGYSVNLYTEFMGVLATIAIIDVINRGRAKREKIEELKARLVREAKSNVNTVAVQAINELRDKGWLSGEDSLLIDAKMWNANLTGADLSSANLKNIHLGGAKLRNTKLWMANLQDAILAGADLQNANLLYVNLSGAILMNANLIGVDLRFAHFDKKTILPDAKFKGKDDKGNQIYDKYWTPETDMTRYTDPNHPDFWQPNWVKNNDKDK